MTLKDDFSAYTSFCKTQRNTDLAIARNKVITVVPYIATLQFTHSLTSYIFRTKNLQKLFSVPKKQNFNYFF